MGIKNLSFIAIIGICLVLTLNVVSASYDRIYIDANVSSPIILQPLDSNVWNISLHTSNQTFNFTWTGTEYILYLSFSSEGNYPFVINSTEVAGSINGLFLSRRPYNVTIKLYNQKASIIPFLSNRYKNDFSYILAELSNGNNVYQQQNQKYTLPLNFKTAKTRYFHAPYINGQAQLKLWERNQYYNLRLVDGSITFDGVYSIPNVTKLYGINAYLGNYRFNGTNQDYTIYVSSDDLHPYRNIFNWSLIGALVFVAVLSVIFAVTFPTASVLFAIFSALTLIIIRIVLLYWIGS